MSEEERRKEYITNVKSENDQLRMKYLGSPSKWKGKYNETLNPAYIEWKKDMEDNNWIDPDKREE